MKRWLFPLYVSFFFFFPSGVAQAEHQLILTVSTSPYSDFYSVMTIQDRNDLAGKIISSKAIDTKEKVDLLRTTVQIGSRKFLLDSHLQLYEPGRGKKILISPRVQKQLVDYVKVLEKAHYGNPLVWSEVKKEFRRMNYAEVIDLETGEKFQVQRRAGSRHADVQPLTKEDTSILKRIYQGKWSWKRRAILVSVNGKYLAASMHGMPHGAGAIKGNNFPGHFCIHFKESSTHSRTEPDPSHSLMIIKASGGLQKLILEASPYQLVDIFLLSMQEQDLSTLEMTTDGFALPVALENISLLKHKIPELHDGVVDLLVSEVHVNVSYVEKGSGEKSGEWVFSLKRHSPLDRWKISDLKIHNKE